MLHRIAGSVFAITACLAFSGSAGAADLGGDCCADLEERVAELEATTARKGNRKVSLTVYGEVNQAVMWWDDRRESNAYVVTNQGTKNLVGFEGEAHISPEWSAGYRLEVEVRTAPSDFVDQGSTNVIGVRTFVGVGDEGNTGVVVRHSNWWIGSKTLGRITLGQGSQATDGIAEIDLSGSTAAAISSVEAWNEGFFLQDSNGNSPVLLSPTLIGFLTFNPSLYVDLFRGNLDGGRGNFVRYDSPVLAGFILSTAWGEDDDWDVALRYAAEFSGFRLAAGIGFRHGVTTDSDNFELNFGGLPEHEVVVGSVSVLHEPTGLFLTFAAGEREWTEPIIEDILLGEKYFYIKGGIYQKWLPLGKTSIYGEYYRVSDVGVKGFAELNESADVWGAGIVQHIDAAAMELYLSYRRYEADNITDVDFFVNNGGLVVDHDIKMDVVMSGARIKF